MADTGSSSSIYVVTLWRYAHHAASYLDYNRSRPVVFVNMGTFRGDSSVAMLRGMETSPSGVRKIFIDVDITEYLQVRDMMQGFCDEIGVQYEFMNEDSAKVVLPSGVDLLFIDTLHMGSHLHKELRRHHSKVGNFIIIHDTEFCSAFGFGVSEKTPKEGEGLVPVIFEFLEEFRYEWELYQHHPGGFGMTVLRRRKIQPVERDLDLENEFEE
jgi:hypothetical protein